MTSDAISVLPLSEADLDEFLPLASAYQDWYGAYESNMARNSSFFHKFLSPSEKGLLLGARIDGKLVGFATLYWTHSSIAATDIALLNDLYVDPASRGMAVGHALIQASARAARERGLARLDWFTEPDNLTAQRLFDRTGAHRSTWVEYSLPL